MAGKRRLTVTTRNLQGSDIKLRASSVLRLRLWSFESLKQVETEIGKNGICDAKGATSHRWQTDVNSRRGRPRDLQHSTRRFTNSAEQRAD